MSSSQAPWSSRLRPRATLKTRAGSAEGKTLAERRGLKIVPLRLPFHGTWLHRKGRTDRLKMFRFKPRGAADGRSSAFELSQREALLDQGDKFLGYT
eukprot:405592-Rhodomonas_salina.1